MKHFSLAFLQMCHVLTHFKLQSHIHRGAERKENYHFYRYDIRWRGGGLSIFDPVVLDVGFAMRTESCSTHALCIGCAQ